MSAYIAYLDEAIAQLRTKAESLKQNGCADEAALCQIELNINDVCRTIYNVCTKLAQGDAFTALYLQKLDRLPGGWQASKEAALAHKDECKAVIEDIKLTTLARNRAKFLALKEE